MRRLRVSVVRSKTRISPIREMETGWNLATPVSMANCVARSPEGSRPRSYRRVTARAVRRKLKAAQEPVPERSREAVFPPLTCIYRSSITSSTVESSEGSSPGFLFPCFLPKLEKVGGPGGWTRDDADYPQFNFERTKPGGWRRGLREPLSVFWRVSTRFAPRRAVQRWCAGSFALEGLSSIASSAGEAR